MKNNVSFPHPVLGINKDVYPILTNDSVISETPVRQGDIYVFRFTLRQRNSAIANLIKDGKAEYVVEADCSKTFYTSVTTSNVSIINVPIEAKFLNGRVNFSFYIVLKEDLNGYTNRFNEDYNDENNNPPSFNLKKGDLLVIFPSTGYNVSVKFDNMFAVSSFMQITKGDDDCTKVNFELNEDIINIELPKPMFEQYNVFNETNFVPIIHSSLVFNALVYALMSLDEPMYSEKTWADSIKCIIKTRSDLQELDYTSASDAFEIASIMLGDPYKRLFDGIDYIINEIDGED